MADWKCGCPKSRTGGDVPCGQCTDDDLNGYFCNICGHDVFCCCDYNDEKRAATAMKILKEQEKLFLDKRE